MLDLSTFLLTSSPLIPCRTAIFRSINNVKTKPILEKVMAKLTKIEDQNIVHISVSQIIEFLLWGVKISLNI